MKNIRIGVRLILGFICVSAMCLLVGAIGYSGISDTKSSLDNVSKTYLPSIEALAQMRFNMRNVIVAQRTLLIPTLPDSERKLDRKSTRLNSSH